MLSKYSIRIIFICSLISGSLHINASEKFLAASAHIEEFGIQIEQSITSGNPFFFNLVFDGERLVRNVIDEFPDSPQKSFEEGFIVGILENLDLGSQLTDEIIKGADFTLLHIEKEGFDAHMLYRLISDDGINYYEYTVEEIGNELKITDAYNFSSGQRISETIKKLYQEQTAQTSVSDIPLEKRMSKIEFFMDEGKPHKVYQNWRKLPFGFKTDKYPLSIGMGAAIKAGKKEFCNTLELFMEYYPEEPSKHLIPLEGLVKHNMFEEALVHIDSLEVFTFSDPMLNFMRANIYYSAGDMEKAAECIGKLIVEMPDMERAFLRTGMILKN